MMYDGLAAAELGRVMRASHCVYLPQVTSTLDVVHELGGEGAPSGTVVLAEEQVAGRGRRGRSWNSPPETGIWLGYLLRPSRPQDNGVLAIRVGLTIAGVMRELCAEAFLKWPNDLLLHGRKVAGVLCEGRWTSAELSWVAVGVGINIRPHACLPDSAVALAEVVSGVTRIEVLELLVPRLQAVVQEPTLQAGELDEFSRYDWLAGRRLSQPVDGVARGIDSSGALLVERQHQIERVVGGSIVVA